MNSRTRTGTIQISLPVSIKIQQSAPEDWPCWVDHETHVEWDDTNMRIPELLGCWNDSNNLYQRWTLLLVDATISNSNGTLQGLVVEAYHLVKDLRASFSFLQDVFELDEGLFLPSQEARSALQPSSNNKNEIFVSHWLAAEERELKRCGHVNTCSCLELPRSATKRMLNLFL